MKDHEALILSVRKGDNRAFAGIIRQFRDMAYGYAYSLLGDFHLAEDAAQEAFVEAYYNLDKLKDPAAFPGWFRRIVKFRCSRFLERKQLVYVPLDAIYAKASDKPEPHELLERQEIKDQVLKAVNSLSQPLREVTTLFYINGYSHKDISGFLEIPMNTVKTRLSASRKQIKRRMSDMIKETFENRKLSDGFESKIIEGVEKIGFWVKNIDGMEKHEQNLPTMNPFPASLRVCLEKMGENYGTRKISAGAVNFHVNNLYVHIMGTSGAAFRLVWSPGEWDHNIAYLISASAEPLKLFRNAFDSVGYDFEIFGNKDYRFDFDKNGKLFDRYENYDTLKESIIKSIRDKDRPVIAMGVVGFYKHSCVVTGYDDSANVLIGWSFFQDNPEEKKHSIDIDPSGYFRQRNWYKNTPAVILIGDKKPKPSLNEIYRKALEQAVILARAGDVADRKCGLEAYKALADDLLKDKFFPAGDLKTLQQRLIIIFGITFEIIMDGVVNADYFLKDIIKEKPELAMHLGKAAEKYSAIQMLVFRCRMLISDNPGTAIEYDSISEPQLKRLADHETHRKIADCFLKIRDIQEEITGLIEKALEKF